MLYTLSFMDCVQRTQTINIVQDTCMHHKKFPRIFKLISVADSFKKHEHNAKKKKTKEERKSQVWVMI